MEVEAQTGLTINAWAALYLFIAAVYLYMAWTEMSGALLTVPKRVVEAQRVPIEEAPGEQEAEEREEENGRSE